MGFWNLLRRKHETEPVVFSGNRWEAEMVMHLLEGEGFHPLEWADLPGPYLGPAGMARVVVPPEELQQAKEFLAGLKEMTQSEEGDDFEPETEDEDPSGS
jgi:hypothetical protein